MKIKKIIEFLETENIEYKFIGDIDYEIKFPFTYDNYENSFYYSMSNEQDLKNYGLLLTRNEIITKSKNVIVTKNSKYVFYHIVSCLFSVEDYSDPITESKENINLSVGYNSVIHKSVEIGKDVKIYDSTVVGRPGFSYYSINGKRRRLKPYGKVILKDGVSISSNCNIDRGNVTNTILHENVVVDSLVHIAHDVVIGKNTTVTAGVIFSGYVTVGENCFLGVNSAFKNGVSIGDNVTVGMGANITKNFGSNLVLVGNPAKIFGHKCDCGRTNRVTTSEYICECGLEYTASKTEVIKK